MTVIAKLRRLLLACCVAGLVPVAASAREAPPAGPLVVPGAEALLDQARAKRQVRVILGLPVPMADESRLGLAEALTQGAQLRARQRALLADLGVDAQREGATAESATGAATLFDTIPFLAVSLSEAALRRALAHPGVASIQLDVPERATLAQSVPLIRADRAAALGFSGAGQTVAVLDTGVARAHPMLAGKLVSEACYSTTAAGVSTSLCPGGVSASTAVGSGANCSLGLLGCEHGTHVASIAVGNSAALKGVARGAKLIAIQVFSRFDSFDACGGAGAPCILTYTSDQIRGLERVYALRKRFSIAAVNMSLGGGSFTGSCDAVEPARKAIIDRLRAAGIATVIASGNDGLDGAVDTPGCISTAVTVGSTTKSDQISFFSNHARMVDLLAPGSNIRAAVPGGFAVLSGTSMATPHVAGAFAILKQAKPRASAGEIQTALACTGRPLSRAGIAKPRIDVLRALNVLRSPATGCR